MNLNMDSKCKYRDDSLLCGTLKIGFTPKFSGISKLNPTS